ncbi:hypothetical protein DOJK_00330 [Patescibacteria group bacterium]|nr:hypothetical protein [Candidatus Dojkabacteria bacterium]CAG1020430.1 hypothetical protein DOJK_00330 [Patescibacteria group bacterium]
MNVERVRFVAKLMGLAGVLILVGFIFNTEVNTPERWLFDGWLPKGDFALISLGAAFVLWMFAAALWYITGGEKQ